MHRAHFLVLDMPLITEITTSFGLFDLTVKETLLGTETVYDCEVLRQNAEDGKAYNIYHAFFRMRYDGYGNLVSPQHPKSPAKADYWVEMEDVVRNHILINS